EALDEHRAVAQPGQRIAEAALAVLRDRPLGVGQRAGDPRRPAGRVADRDAAALKPQIGAVLVADAMLVLDVIVLPGAGRAERLLQRLDVVGMHAIEPARGAAVARRWRQADRRPPPRREVALLGPQIPLPQAVVGSFGEERQPLV